MKILTIIFFLCVFSCKETHNNNAFAISNLIINQTIEEEKDTLKIVNNVILDSIYVGASFYKINSLKNFQFIGIDPYEDFLIDNDNNMYNVIIYQKNNIEYAILVLLEENIGMGELSPEWKKTKKTILDYIKYPKGYKKCWYHSFKNDDEIECCLYVIQHSLNDNFKSWRIDYEKRKFILINKHIVFECQ